MTLFDSSGLRDRIRRNPATWGPSSGFVENTGAAFDAFMRGERTVAVGQAMNEEYELLAEEARKVTGDKRIQPPQAVTMAPAVSGGGAGAAVEDTERRKREFLSKMVKINEDHGTALPVTEDELMERVRDKAHIAEEEFIEVSRRSTWPGFVGMMGGSMAAAMTDPPILAASLAAMPYSISRLGLIAAEAGLGAGSEAVAQPFIQQQRKELGLPNSTERALFAIAAAGLGGAALPALGMGLSSAAKGIARSAREGASPTTAKKLAEFMERTDEMTENVPFQPVGRAQSEYVHRLDATLSAIQTRGALPENLPPLARHTPVIEKFRASSDVPSSVRTIPDGQAGETFGAALKQSMLSELEPELEARLRADAARQVLDTPRLEEALATIRNAEALRPLRDDFISTAARVDRTDTPQQRAAATRARKRLAGSFAAANPQLWREGLEDVPRDAEGRAFTEPEDVLSARGQQAFDRYVKGEDVVSQSGEVLRSLGVDVSRLSDDAVRVQLQSTVEEAPAQQSFGEGATSREAADAARALDNEDDTIEAAMRELDEAADAGERVALDPELVAELGLQIDADVRVSAHDALEALKEEEKALKQLEACMRLSSSS